MTATERYITLALGIIGILGFLWRIAWSTGQLVQKLDDHITRCDRTDADHETRIRTLERPAVRRRP